MPGAHTGQWLWSTGAFCEFVSVLHGLKQFYGQLLKSLQSLVDEIEDKSLADNDGTTKKRG